MAFSDPVNTSSSGKALVDGVLWGKEWSDGTPATTSLAVYIAGANGTEGFDFGVDVVLARTANQETQAFRLAMQLIENVCNVDFVEVGNKTNADIVVGAVGNFDAGGALGVAVPPGEDVGALANQQGAVIVNRAAYQNEYASLQQGGYDFISFIHELGHAIGLKHPHDRGGGAFPKFAGVTSEFGDLGDFRLNQGIFTMMSYNDGYPGGPLGKQNPNRVFDHGWQGTPMAIDIAALQHLYGANMSFHTGNDVYTLPAANAGGSFFSCIWDTGGTDTIKAGGSAACIIDLNAATLKVAKGGGGFVSSHEGILGGYTIAKGVTIENAQGGGGDDALTGNKAANGLAGLGGIDVLTGGKGADTLTGGGGGDYFAYARLIDSRGANADVITDFAGSDVIDLSAIDGDGTGRNDAFRLIGSDDFNGKRGELRFSYDSTNDVTRVEGDFNGDFKADITILLNGNIALNPGDFVL